MTTFWQRDLFAHWHHEPDPVASTSKTGFNGDVTSCNVVCAVTAVKMNTEEVRNKRIQKNKRHNFKTVPYYFLSSKHFI